MKNFRLLVSIALTVSVLSLPTIIAQDNNSETASQIVQPAIDSERDTIIEDAIHELNNNKVSYDGKAVTIYNVPNSEEKIKAILMMFLSLVPPTASILFNYNFENIFYTNLNHKMATAIVVLGVLTGLIILGNGLKTFYNETEYAQKNIPLVTLDDTGLLFKGRLISWDHIFKTKLFIDKIAGQTTLSLCDEYLNSKFELKKINTHCPITVDELASFINYYIDKKHPENAQLNQEKTTTGDSFITKFIKLTASNNLSFDGKKLTFYNVPNKSEMAKAALFMAIATAIGGLSVWLTLEVNPATMGTSGYLSMGVIGLMALGFFIY